MLHVPEIVFFSQSIKRWHLVAVSRQRARSGVILDNCLPASTNAVFMVVSGRRLNSLCIYVRSHKLQKITKSETFKWFSFQLLAIAITHFTFLSPWHGRNLSIFQGCIFFVQTQLALISRPPVPWWELSVKNRYRTDNTIHSSNWDLNLLPTFFPLPQRKKSYLISKPC